jgi:molybdopterin-guanine dinucleotide biosynthesis protein A
VEDVLGAILAGGQGSRLGRPKPTALLGGRPLIEHPLRALEAAGIETVLVAKEATALPPGTAPVWTELDEPVHPLLGIVTALDQADGRAVLACACDMPFVSPALAASIAETSAPLVVPRAGGRLHPLFARYAHAMLPALREALARRAPLQETVASLAPLILEESDLRAFGDPERLFFNVNTPAELARAEGMLVDTVDVADEDIESLRRGFESFSRGDIEEMMSFSAPDVVVYDAPELPGGGVHRGRDAVRRGLEEIRATFDDLEMATESFTRVDNRILVVFRARGHGRGSGIPLDVRLANVFTMKNGIVLEWHAYTSEALAREALGLD